MRIYFLLITLLLISFSCSNESNSTTEKVEVKQELDARVQQKMKANPPPIVGEEYGSQLIQIDSLTDNLRQYITNGIWLVEGGYFGNDKKRANRIKGQAYQFYPDHSFDFNLEKADKRSGHWAIEGKGEERVIKLDFDSGKDAEYHLKMVNKFMLWIATHSFEKENVQIKLIHKESTTN